VAAVGRTLPTTAFGGHFSAISVLGGKPPDAARREIPGFRLRAFVMGIARCERYEKLRR
jgi:hypothetical protein